jgi:hypothetical protein
MNRFAAVCAALSLGPFVACCPIFGKPAAPEEKATAPIQAKAPEQTQPAPEQPKEAADPVESLKAIIAKVQLNGTAPRVTDLKKPGVWWEKRRQMAVDIKYDVRKTDSLVSPYAATVTYGVETFIAIEKHLHIPSLGLFLRLGVIASLLRANRFLLLDATDDRRVHGNMMRWSETVETVPFRTDCTEREKTIPCTRSSSIRKTATGVQSMRRMLTTAILS